MSKLYPIGIQNFESLRKDGYYYVDKTEIIYNLAKTGRYYFLSRPRRFGKSLLISTLEAYFQGKKELFTGLAMEKLEKEWIAYPILHLDLNTENYSIPQNLELKLERALSAWEQLYGSDPAEKSLASRFEGIIQRAYEKTGQRVVILVDEYDKPMLQAIGNEALQTSYRNTLKGFYGALKSKDGCIRFGILTGVTKFSKVSVFSDLNNLNDISMDDLYVELCGITEKEIHTNFEDELHELKVVKRQEVAQKIKEAREQGDLSENAEYDAAKDEQRDIEARIEELEKILKNAEVVVEDEVDLDKINIGCKVKILDLEYNEELEYKIVGSTEANSLKGKISNESPVGKALLGAKVDDVVNVETHVGMLQYKVLEIQRSSN